MKMNNELLLIKQETERIVKELAKAKFYQENDSELAVAKDVFFNDKTVLGLQSETIAFLYDDYRYGILHSKNVSLDTASLILHEAEDESFEKKNKLIFLGEIAGLLYNIYDPKKDCNSDSVKEILNRLAEMTDERTILRVLEAQSNLEMRKNLDEDEKIITYCLYDANLFRYGADTVATLLWEHFAYEELTIVDFYNKLPALIEKTFQKENIFLSETGKKYGPEILAIGLSSAQNILAWMENYINNNKAIL